MKQRLCLATRKMRHRSNALLFCGRPHYWSKQRFVITNESYPNIQVAIDDVLIRYRGEMVSNNAVELGNFLWTRQSFGFVFYPLYDDRFHRFLLKDHLWRARDNTLASAFKYDFITLQRRSSVRALIESSLHDARHRTGGWRLMPTNWRQLDVWVSGRHAACGCAVPILSPTSP